MFRPGTLRDQVRRTADQALKVDALHPLATRYEYIDDAGVRFLVRIMAGTADKPQASDADKPQASDADKPQASDADKPQASDADKPQASDQNTRINPANPFLPYDAALHVADASSTHVCLLNKYPVVNDHLLLVTRRFVSQLVPLDEADFAALCVCMAEYDALGFYNAGAAAGASQPHKHLQMVPLPLTPDGQGVPLDALIESATFQGPIGQSQRLPFCHAIAHLDTGLFSEPAEAACITLDHYRRMMIDVGLPCEANIRQRGTGAYNLLVTRRWMLLVPRSHETFHTISLNALALAGALLVRDMQQLEILDRHGPMAALTHVVTPRPS